MALDGGLERAWQPGLYAWGNAQQITGVLLVSIPQGLLREQMGATPTEALRIQQALDFVGMVLGVLLLQLLGHVLTFVFFIFCLFVLFFFISPSFLSPFLSLPTIFFFILCLTCQVSGLITPSRELWVGLLPLFLFVFLFVCFCHWRHLDLAKANAFCEGPESTFVRLCGRLCAAAQLCHCHAKAAMANAWMSNYDCVPIKLHWQSWLWATTPGPESWRL